MIEGMRLGYTRPVLFDRQAVGGEYGASFGICGKGRAETIFYPEDGEPTLIESRKLVDDQSAVVVYSNPLDQVTPMAHHFFKRCLDAKVMPCVVTKKTVFKWQEVRGQLILYIRTRIMIIIRIMRKKKKKKKKKRGWVSKKSQ